jgi:hypothetical protein
MNMLTKESPLSRSVALSRTVAAWIEHSFWMILTPAVLLTTGLAMVL